MTAPADALAISTCYASAGETRAEVLLDRLAEVGLARLELDYRIQEKEWPRLVRELKPRGIAVVSLHNFAPHPASHPPEAASGDLHNLAALDKEERGRAVAATLCTLEAAAELEAGAVVLHLGRLEGTWDRGVLRAAARAGETTPALAAQLAARAAAAPRALDAASFALERLLGRAASLGVALGLENRSHVFQLPDLADLSVLRGRFAGAPLAPWLDLGHARLAERAGLPGPEAWLAAAGGAAGLLGCHLHDSQGDRDHLAPGAGEEDWERVAELCLASPRKVLEIHPGPPPEEVAQGAARVAAALAAAARRALVGKEVVHPAPSGVTPGVGGCIP